MDQLDRQDKLFDPPLANHNDDNGANHIDQNTLPDRVVQRGKQNNLDDQLPLSTSNRSNETSSNVADKNSNKDEFSTIVDESEKPITTMKKRVTPIPSSYARRRPNPKMDPINPKVPSPTTITVATAAIKKPSKSSPIFIAPKKTSPQPPSFSSLIRDDSLQRKRKAILERQTVLGDEQQPSTMTNWTPAPPSSRFYIQPSGSSLEENSDEESDHESLLIRGKNSKTQSLPRVHSPLTIFLTDPDGCLSTVDLDGGVQDQADQNKTNADDESGSTGANTAFDGSTSSNISIIHDKYALHSIGEENEDDQELLKFQRQESLDIHHEVSGRRWSDGVVDEEKERASSPQSSLTKMASAASVAKQAETSSPKVSKAKYFLMKLHLTSSSKDDTSDVSTAKKRTVRRSSDKKHSRSQLSGTTTVSNTLLPNEPIQRTQSTTESIQSANSSLSNKPPTKHGTFGSVGNLDAVDSDDDDIDGTVEEVKMGSQMSINSVFSETKARYGLDISGTIELKLTYVTAIGALDVFIEKCTHLARAKRHGSDPYVKIYLLPDRSKNSKRKTAVKKNTVDPLFEEKFRYHLTKQEFESRVLWISVWSQAPLGHNDFLGEIHIPLANCTLDTIDEYELLAKKHKNDLSPSIEPTMDPGEIQFQLTFIENPKNKDLGVLQVHHIEAKAIYYGKSNADAVCKGFLMPDNIKRKLPNVRKGPSPKWELPLRWEGVRRDNLKNTSIEISIWCQERFRKIMFGFVRLNLAQGHFDNRAVKWLDATNVEKSAWETFLSEPSQVHEFRLPLRPGTTEK